VETRLLDGAEKFHRWTVFHQHDIILPAEELREVFEVARELRLRLGRIERFAFGDPAFGKRIEDKHARCAAFRLRIDIQCAR
jgi:hypothetical protein